MQDITFEMLTTDVVVQHEPINSVTWPDGTQVFCGKPEDALRVAQLWRAAVGLRAITGGPPVNPAMTLLQEFAAKATKLINAPPDPLPPSVRDFINRGEKIGAIKEYRHLTGAGLKDAKDVVEANWTL
jgi:hypothetical protein